MDWLRSGGRRHVDYEWRNCISWRDVRIGLERRNRPCKYQCGNLEPESMASHGFHQRLIGIGRRRNGGSPDQWKLVNLSQQLYRRWKNHGQWRHQRVLFLRLGLKQNHHQRRITARAAAINYGGFGQRRQRNYHLPDNATTHV